MPLNEFLKGISVDDMNSAFAIVVREEQDPNIDLTHALDHEAQEYPIIAELLDSIGSEMGREGDMNTAAIQRLHGMFLLARALVVLAEREQLH